MAGLAGHSRRTGFAAALGAGASYRTSESADDLKQGNVSITSSDAGRLGDGWFIHGAGGGDAWRSSDVTGSGTGGTGAGTGGTGSET
jgi:hypothetical protein